MSKKKTKKISDKEARAVIEQFMNEQNRPFSSILLQTSLATRGVGKTQCTKMLEALASDGDLTMGLFGKNKIYWRVQNEDDALTPEEKANLKENIASLTEEEKVIAAECASLESKISSLLKQPTNEEADDQIQSLTVEKEALETKLKRVTDAAAGMNEATAVSIEKKYDTALKLWKARKRKCCEITGEITESASMSLSALKEEVGLETDEDVGAVMPVEAHQNKRRKL